MRVSGEQNGRIKVILSADDIKHLGLDMQRLNCDEADTRYLLQAVFRLAAQKAGICTRAHKLFIEAYPFCGGGIFYFTALSTDLKARPRKKAFQCFVYDFYDAEDLIAAAELLSRCNAVFKSDIYSFKAKYRLVAYCSGSSRELYAAKELCDEFTKSEAAAKYAEEYGKPIAKGNAVKKLWSHFTKKHDR